MKYINIYLLPYIFLKNRLVEAARVRLAFREGVISLVPVTSHFMS